VSDQDLAWAIRDLADAIREYTQVKKRGIALAEEIENKRFAPWVEQ